MKENESQPLSEQRSWQAMKVFCTAGIATVGVMAGIEYNETLPAQAIESTARGVIGGLAMYGCFKLMERVG